jgi:hypothetical protein
MKVVDAFLAKTLCGLSIGAVADLFPEQVE